MAGGATSQLPDTVWLMTITMPTEQADGRAPLRLSLSGVAELAGVRRPVASMWRTRFASGGDAFPAPIARVSGSPLFDAGEVAEWLARTGHGNNLDAVADAAALAAPDDLDWSDAEMVAELDALVCLSAHLDGITGLSADDLVRAANDVDRLDAFLAREVKAYSVRGVDWTGFTDQLIDAAYSPAGALERSRARHAATAAGDGSAGALADGAFELVLDVAQALATRLGATEVVVDRGIDERIGLRIATALGDGPAVTVTPSHHERSIRRHLHVAGVWLGEHADIGAALRVARVPAAPRDGVEQMLADAEDVVLSLRDDDVAVIIGPTRALVDVLPACVRTVRDDILRSGRLRAVVRLPRRLVTAAVGEPLALWVLGPPTGEVALGDRFTAIADVIDGELTPATRADIVSDVAAGMGSAADVRARTFRFARLVRTASLLARSGELVAPRAAAAISPARAASLAAHVDAAAHDAQQDVPASIAPVPSGAEMIPAAGLADLIADGHARVVAGTRLTLDAADSAGLVVVTAGDLDDPEQIGRRRVDPMTFVQRHPSAQLTRPGDVVFRTGPTAAAWVDHDGSKIVAYPARVLRISPADPGGLVPELVAADIATQASGPGAWKRWMLHRVAPAAIAPLRRALAELAAARADLTGRIARLDHYIDTLASAVAAGAVTLTEPGAPASTPK